MKFNKIILTLFAVSMILISCKKESEYKDYEGNWSGTYTGDDTGTWNVNIDDEGKVTGSAVSDSLPFFTLTGEGEISKDGELNTTISNFGISIVFKGQAKDNSISGTWSYVGQDFSGTWSGKKN